MNTEVGTAEEIPRVSVIKYDCHCSIFFEIYTVIGNPGVVRRYLYFGFAKVDAPGEFLANESVGVMGTLEDSF